MNIMNMIEKINQTATYIRSRVSSIPETAIILGTGLGALVDHIEDKTFIPYTEIPNFPVSTVEGHSGNLISDASATYPYSPCRDASTTTKATT